jgi:hypothetical protein
MIHTDAYQWTVMFSFSKLLGRVYDQQLLGLEQMNRTIVV